MNIAVLSGKGGTGKTTVSTNLALALKANYIDCDVEEPNGFLFLKPQLNQYKKVMVEYPIIDKNICTLCRACKDVCQFNAIAQINRDIILFDKLCHSCGACKLACKYDALSYGKREIGRIEKGTAYGINCSRGILNIGEPMAVPIIRELLNDLLPGVNLIDFSPGTSCNVVNPLKYSDSAILVTEPTKFGLHDLRKAVELVKLFHIPFAVIVNKDNGKENETEVYCKEQNISIIGKIPYKKDIAQIYSKGKILYNTLCYKCLFDELAYKARKVLKWN